MNSTQKRFILFLGGCIPTRLLFAYISKISLLFVNQILAFIAFLIGTGFIYIYFTGSRKTGIETGGEPIWWNNLRPFHAIFYYLFAYMIYIKKIKDAWKIIVVDTMMGLFAFLLFHWNNGDFKKLK